MIKIEFDINMPDSCDICPLQDDEFNYCHGHLPAQAWELTENYIQGCKKPTWCPLIEVKKEKEKLGYNIVSNKLSSKEISDFSPTGAKVY